MEHDGRVTVIYHWHHPNLQEYARILREQLGNIVTVSASDPASALIVAADKPNIARVETLVKLIHHPDAPVLIEAKVVELRWDRSLQIGLEGDLTAGSAIFTKNAGSEAALREVRIKFNPSGAVGGSPFQGSTFQFQDTDAQQGTFGGIIQSFVEKGKAQILSQPRVIVKAGEKATIHAGEEIPSPTSFTLTPGGTTISVLYRKVGVTLEVTPHLAAPGQLILKLKPSVSTTLPTLVPISPTFQAPQFSVREVDTEVLVRDGEEVVIGGLVRRQTQELQRGIPFLSDIPILGYLFGKYEEVELVQEILFFIKPRVMSSEEQLPSGVFDPGKPPDKK